MLFSQNEKWCKNPVGAVTAGTTVTFRIALTGVEQDVEISVSKDGQSSGFSIPMKQIPGGREASCDFSDQGLFFYEFRIGGQRAAGPFQQTVYSSHYVSPDGFCGGIIYQIFPDRFAISGKILQTQFTDRILHTDTTDVPVYLPDSRGEIRNNDYFGGNFQGIIEKLDYLQGLGISCIYLNPIFESHSNHRYDTACYKRLDPLLGTEQDFSELCTKAHALGIKIVLDGVFSHTGADSEYFNKNGRYSVLGAYQSKQSAYFPWFKFRHFPDDYVSWWGFKTLPETDETNAEFIEYICGENGVIDHWMQLGADGFRLDVADELPDAFIAKIRTAVKRHGPNTILIGEVWEDASNKISYGSRRHFLLGDELDSVMNYPFRDAILDFVRFAHADVFMQRITGIVSNYPKPMLDHMMNMLSTHDTARAMNVMLMGECKEMSRAKQASISLHESEYFRGVEMLKLAMVLQFTLPGIPSIYYGDEIGMQGMRDPFNRAFMHWNHIDENLLRFTRELSAIRRGNSVFAEGDFIPVYAQDALVAFLRADTHHQVLIAVNRSETKRTLDLIPGGSIEIEPWRYIIKEIPTSQV